nr:4'-phosphopantetheinyl transferase superfamily protein [Acinetobacter sp. Marseille-Q1620]
MTQRSIQIHVQTLAQILDKGKEDFSNLKLFNQYKKNQIYQHRNSLLAEVLAHPVDSKDIARSEFGKPYLQDYPQLNFNHTHSQKNYALAMSLQVRDLGIDIEDMDRSVRFDALAKHAFHMDEYETWESLGFDSAYWFKVWTTKEAVLKASGLGIRLSLNELNTQVHALNDGGICIHPDIGHYAYHNFNLGHAMLTVAWRSELSCKGFAFPQIQIIQD